MKIYIASKFENKDTVRELQRRFLLAGHQITFDWTGCSDEGMEAEAKAKYWMQCAERDRRGVIDCDVFILLCRPEMRGAWVELGVALATNKKIILVGSGRETVFTEATGIFHVDTLEQAYMEATK